jgi:hypothetical protein
MRCRLAYLTAGLLLSTAGLAQAQAKSPRPLAAVVPLHFESWRPAAALDRGTPAAGQFVPAPRHRTRQALLGGAIGAAAGVVFCTVVSTLADDSADGGLSFCPLDSYLLIGGAGFALGFAMGWVI